MKNKILSRDIGQKDLENDVKFFMVYIATAIVWLSISKDIAQIGFKPIWVAVRLFYLPFVLSVAIISRKLAAVNGRWIELPIWAGSLYITLYSNYFAAETGLYLKSNYVFGLVQLYFGISLMAVSAATFYGCIVMSISASFLICWISLGTIQFDASIAPMMGTLIVFSSLTHHTIKRNVAARYALMVNLESSIRTQQDVIKEQSRQLADAEISLAIARMTQMLAHDVRKPFSMLRMGLGMLGKAQDPAGVKNVLSRLVPEIDKAISSVDGLISDVMEVGSNSTELIQESTTPEALIVATLGEVCRVYPKAEISIDYNLAHQHQVNVHAQKVGRVFSNILGNAIQSMGYRGNIWFKTREQGGFVEFTVGNTGSIIPAESLPRLFEAFFTSGKKGGTGLGLAIAQKVVKAHGGRIWCESTKNPKHPNGYVEFKFTLPIASSIASETDAKLPRHSSEIAKGLFSMAEAAGSSTSLDSSELNFETEIIALAKAKGRPIHVLIVDDEEIYRSALASLLGRTPEMAGAVLTIQAEGYAAGLVKLADEPDLVITDVDMGSDGNGFNLVEEIRLLGYSGLVCVHSNRMVAADHRTALDNGADAFIPKPVARAQLLKLVIQAAQQATVAALVPTPNDIIATTRPQVLVVDDNPFILDAWAATLMPDAEVHLIASHEDLAALLEKDPTFLWRLAVVVTDYHFDGSHYDGQDVAQLIKQQRPLLKVLLSSDGVFTAGELNGPDRVIGKDPVKLEALMRA